MLTLTGRYISSHWKGQQGLAWSFWINFVLLRAIILGIQEYATPPLNETGGQARFDADWRLVLLATVFFHGIVFVWQAVGVIRAGETWLVNRGSQAPVWGAQAALLAGFWATVTFGLSALPFTAPEDSPRNIVEIRRDSGKPAAYRLETVTGSPDMIIRGSLDPGITRNLRAFMDRNPAVRNVLLESDGGNIFEARGIARVIRDRQMNTIVERECLSACTTAFIGGRKRILAEGARLGFHQYSLAGTSLFTDSKAEEGKDREIFAKAGVEPTFLDQMYQAPPSGMWYPPPSLLLETGVIHELSKTR